MVTTPRSTTFPRLLALAVACVVVMLAPAVVGTARAHAADAPVCAPSALLASQALPRRALALLAAPGAPTCPEVVSEATRRIHEAALLATSAAESVNENKWADALKDATDALAEDRDNSAADASRAQASAELAKAKAGVAATAEAKKSWLEKLKDQWNSFFDQQLSPVSGLLLPFLGVLFGLVLAARLVVLVVRQWPNADDLPKDRVRRAVLAAGVLSTATASVLASLVAGDSNTEPLSRAMTALTVLSTLASAVLGFRVARRAQSRALLETKHGSELQAQREAERGRVRGTETPEDVVAGSEGAPGVGARWWQPQSYEVVMGLSIGAGAVAVTGLVTRWAGGNDADRGLQTGAVLGLATVLALQGVWLLAWWLATRIRLDVKNSTSAAEIGTVVALLSELGAEKPRGLEVPRGADVTALDGVLGSLPENPVLKVLKDIIRSIAGVTPWTATIEGDAKNRVVTVVRNGKTLGSAIIDPARLGLTDDDASEAADTKTDKATAPDHTLQMAAAFVMCTMAEVHPAIRRGLAGTTSWESLGYHYVGSTMHPSASDAAGRLRKQALLARALDDDPGNRAARLAFRHAIDRDATDFTTLCAYAEFLKAYSDELSGPMVAFDANALRLRASYTRALVLVNAVHADAAGHPEGKDAVDAVMKEAKAELLRLNALVKIEPDDTGADPLAEFKSRFADDVRGVHFLVGQIDEPPVPSSPVGMYNLGCTYASRNDVPWTPGGGSDRSADDETARAWLELACEDPAAKEWMTTDPQLDKFRTRKTYRAAFLTAPRTDFFSLSTVKPFAPRLKGGGYGDTSLLAVAEPLALSHLVAGDLGVAGQLVELARLHLGLGAASPVDDTLDQMVETVHRALSSTTPASVAAALIALKRIREGLTHREPDSRTTSDDTGTFALDHWAIEILDQLITLGLAHGGSLVALPVSRQSAIATTMAKSLMKAYQPEETDNLDGYESRLGHALAAWFRQPYSNRIAPSPPPTFR